MWVDISSLVVAVALDADGAIIKYALKDFNRAELNAQLKRTNFTLKWQAKVICIYTDSFCMYLWITNIVTGKSQLNIKAASEILRRQWLDILTLLF